MKVELIEEDPCRKLLMAEINNLLRKHPDYSVVRKLPVIPSACRSSVSQTLSQSLNHK
ncbi:hypothetical protein [Fulvivirga kasyanovii]|uniref:hypothetical protein n=1 Tax=Fulvivirga kasyanovii TaxID=396812 RepID=UPI0012BB89B7|nr:hypothetical protein [Fulvivirga kasyanovii]